MINFERKAKANMQKWGKQDFYVLLLGAMEEMGELAQAYLQYMYEDADYNRISEEVEDLGALLFQMKWDLEDRGPDE